MYAANDFYSPDLLYRNNGDETFTNVAPEAFPHTPWYSMGCDVADINNDGWLDLMGSDMSGSSHYSQKASMGNMSANAWFLEHPTPPSGHSFSAQHADTLHFGLGKATRVPQIEIVWPNGKRSKLEGRAVDQYHTVSP